MKVNECGINYKVLVVSHLRTHLSPMTGSNLAHIILYRIWWAVGMNISDICTPKTLYYIATYSQNCL